MTDAEYAEARNDFLNILTKQPNLLSPHPLNDLSGKRMAEMMFGFIQQHYELKKKTSVGPSLP